MTVPLSFSVTQKFENMPNIDDTWRRLRQVWAVNVDLDGGDSTRQQAGHARADSKLFRRSCLDLLSVDKDFNK